MNELGRIWLPLSELEEDNLAFCVSDAARCSGNVDRLELGEDELEAFNFEQEFGDVQRCLRCRQGTSRWILNRGCAVSALAKFGAVGNQQVSNLAEVEG